MTRPHHGKPGRRGPGLVLGALLALALAPAAAIAAPPDIMSGPTVSGTPEVGQTLNGEAEWEGTPSWRWMRCEGVELDDDACEWIDDARQRTYTATAADRGYRLRVMLTVRHRGASEWGISSPTSAVADAPPPTTAPAPEPSPSPEPIAPAPAPVVAPVVEVLDEQAAARPRMMSPVPLVRIRGRTTPAGARISLRCYGRGCPARRWARIASTTRVLRFERELRAGTKLVIRITKAGRIGKYTTIVIRKNRVPKRSDRCLYPGRSRPAACPAA